MTKRKINIKIIVVLSLFLFCNLISNLTANADEPKKEQARFSYKVNFPDNQMNNDVGYYHLKVEPGQEQTVQLTFSNPGKVKTAVGISLNGAKTNSNGVIEYGDTNIKNDKSLKFDFKKIVSAPKKVELNPGETKNIDFKIKMPETSFDGVVSGGIQMIQENQTDVEDKGGSLVLNEYAFIVGMLLQETDVQVKPKLKLNSVEAGQANYKNTVYINYSNTQATTVNNMTTEVQINKKGEDIVLYERKQTKMRMAPNSFIAFPVAMNGEKMVEGDYTAKILVTADDGVKEEWTKDFKITKEQADKFNERDVGLVQDKGFNWKLIAMIVIGFFVVVVIIVVVVNVIRKSKKKGSNKKSSKKKNKSRK